MKNEAKRIENYIDDISGEKEKKKVIAIKKIKFNKKKVLIGVGIAAITFCTLFGVGLKGIKYRSIVKEIDKLSEELYFTGINEDIRNKYLSLFDYVVENKLLSNKEKDLLLNMIKNKLNFINRSEETV